MTSTLWLAKQSLKKKFTDDLNVPEARGAFHIVRDDEISIDQCSITVWTLSLLIQTGREGNVCLKVGPNLEINQLENDKR